MKLIDFKHEQEISFVTRYSNRIYTGMVNHYKQKSGRIFASVRCKDKFHFIDSEITKILTNEKI